MILQKRIGRMKSPVLLLVLAVLLLSGCDIIGPLIGMAPEADAGSPRTVDVGDEVTLNAGGSTGQGLSYKWVLLDKPSGSDAEIDYPTEEIAHFTADVAGTYTIKLTVKNQYGEASDTLYIEAEGGTTAQAPSKPGTPNAIETTTTSITLEWAPSTPVTADGYYVFRDVSFSGGFSTAVGSYITSTTIVASGLQPSSSYYFRVRAQNANGSTFSDVAGPFTTNSVASTLNPPANLRSTATLSQSVALAWDVAGTASSYKILRLDPIGGDYTISVYTGSSLSFLDTGLQPDTDYFYKAQAYYGAPSYSWSSLSTAFTVHTPALAVAPNAPATAWVANQTSSSLTVCWSASAGATGYRVLRFDAGSFVQIGADLGAAVFSYLDSGLNESTPYYYQVVAFNGSGSSDPKAVSGTTTATGKQAPPPTTISSVGSATETSLTIAWLVSEGADGYRLQRKTSATSWVDVQTSLTGTTYTDYGLYSATGYSYQVLAYKMDGETRLESAFSPAVSGTTLAPVQPPNPPYGPNPMDGATDLTAATVAFSWYAPTNPDGDYSLYYDVYIGVDGASPTKRISGIIATNWTPPAGYILPGNDYQWYVAVRDSKGHNNTSQTWSFNTADETVYGPSVTAYVGSIGPYKATVTTISLNSSVSYGSSGVLTDKVWEIVGYPTGSTCAITPSADGLSASFLPDLPGVYTVSFTVTDGNELQANWLVENISVVASDAGGAIFYVN